MKLEILYQDNHLIAVNKTAGEPVQLAENQPSALNQSVAAYIRDKYHKKGNVYLATLHRLDQPSTGVVLFAKTSKAAARVSDMFQKKKIAKKYWLITRNLPPSEHGTLQHWLRKNQKNNKSAVFLKEQKHTKHALLNYRLVGQLEKHWAVEVDLKTGRHHQIRAQFAKIQCPIKGDVKYGDRRANPDRSICLHARSISFEHPVTQVHIAIQAPPPKESIWKAFMALEA